VEVDLMRMIEGKRWPWWKLGYEDMYDRFKMMLYSIQSSAGPWKIRPKDGLPACIDNLHWRLFNCQAIFTW
jgi:hypothetical protein